MRLADWLMEALYERGIRHAFTVVGGGAMHLNDALGAHGGIEVISTHHEQGASIAAQGYAMQSGVPALCLVTTGPGGTNAITGVASSWVDSVPMIIISGQVKRPDLVGDTGLRQRGVQEIGITRIVESITKYAEIVLEPNDIRYHLEKAFHLATSGRRGPVWIDVPLDVQGAPIEPDQLRGYTPESAGAGEDPRPIALQVIEMLHSAERPVLLIGAGVRLSDSESDVLQLAEKIGAPVLSTWPGQGVVGDDHPLFIGRPGTLAPRGANFALQNSDFLLGLGTRLDLITTGYDPKDFARSARKVVVDIDPFELAKLKGAIELAHCGDVGEFVRELHAQIDADGGTPWIDTRGWLERCQDWRRRYPLVTAEHRVPGETISTYRLAEVVSDAVDPSDVLALCCSGLGIEIFLLAMRLHTGQRAIYDLALGAMGCGPPTALGACLAAGNRRTICVDGDGGLQLNVQELQTISRLKLPIKLFVLSNDGYASIRASQNRWFGRLVGADPSSGLTLPPLDLLAATYGWSFRRLDGMQPLAEQVRGVLELDGPVLCDVPTPNDEPRIPNQASEALPDGGMRSLPLEDLAPRLPREEFLENMGPFDETKTSSNRW